MATPSVDETILTLLRTEPLGASSVWIRLGTRRIPGPSLVAVTEALDRLERAGLVELERGVYRAVTRAA